MTTLTAPTVPGSPPTTAATYADYLALPHDGRMAEWVNGEIVQFMPPTESHQDITGFLYHLLRSYTEFHGLGKALISPFEMRCHPDGNSREPDVLFVAKANLSRLSDSKRLLGPADLVIEVVSEDSMARDYDEKFTEYEECGVPEYWIVDPRPRRRRATFYQRGADGLFVTVNPENGVYRSQVLNGFWLKPAWLWALPNPLEAFGEIVGLLETTLNELRQKSDTGLV